MVSIARLIGLIIAYPTATLPPTVDDRIQEQAESAAQSVMIIEVNFEILDGSEQ